MKEELDKRLVEAFPLLYADRNASKQKTCMRYGFPGNGWFDIIWNLSSKLEPLIQRFIDENPVAPLDYPKAFQVKEKFGGLRFYMTFGTDEMFSLVSEAETLSFKTCEECGDTGEERSRGWIRILCDNCHINWDKIRQERWNNV